MRVITGSAKGVPLLTLPGTELTRPTTDRAKEGVFSALQFAVAERAVLDLFAGSGQLGIECLSRGAGRCTFVEKNNQAVAVIKKNLRATKLEKNATIAVEDVFSFLQKDNQRYDLVFLDPPYADDKGYEVLHLLHSRLRPGGSVFCESSKARVFEEIIGLKEKRQYQYGAVKVTQFIKSEEEI